jgi:hypothetical protein
MEVSKLTNGSRAGVLVKRSGPAPKSSQLRTVPSEVKRIGKTATKKAKTERPQSEGNQKIEIGEARLPLLRERRLGPQLHQAARSPMPQMFQQALWNGGGADSEDEGQEVDLL